jgi:hypothetical protein
MAKVMGPAGGDEARRLERLLDEVGAAGLSRYWRRNISQLESSELAYALRALEKVAGHVGRNVGRIEWAGMSRDDTDVIVLDPGLIMGDYPIPALTFDYLVGIVVHEALHRKEWTDLVWKKSHEATSDMPVREKIAFHKIVYTGEDIYVDLFSQRNILGEYVRLAREVELRQEEPFLGDIPVSLDRLVHDWRRSAFEQNKSVGIEQIDQVLSLLHESTGELRSIGLESGGVVRRCELRARLYLETWKKIAPHVEGWKILDMSLLWYPRDDSKKVRPIRRKRKVQTRLSANLAQDIEEKLAAHSADITPIIRKVAGADNPDVVPTSRWDFNNPISPALDPRMIGRVQGVLQSYAERVTVYNRGLTSGRVDRRRLYRAPVTGRCFFEKQALPSLDWNICLLVDASGSMAGARWRMVESIVATLHKAFHGFRNRLQAFGYFEVDGVCMLSSLLDGKRVLSIPPSGQTASGQALIAAAYFMPKDARRRFIIHVTDGEPNFGCDVQLGIDHCLAERIHLVTLGVACKDREAMVAQYGNGIRFLDHFGQLPGAIEHLLKWTLLGEAKALMAGSRPVRDKACAV